MNEKLASYLRHAVTALPSVGGYLVTKGWLEKAEGASLDAAAQDFLMVLAAIVAAVLSRLVLRLLNKYAPHLLPFFGSHGSGGNGGAAGLVVMGTAAVLLGGSLSSCAAITADYDVKGEVMLFAEDGAKAGLRFEPGKPVAGFARVAVRDPETGKVTGYSYVEISRKAKVIAEK